MYIIHTSTQSFQHGVFIYINVLMYVCIVTYRFYPCCRICLGFLGGHWTESIIVISQPIVFFTRFIFTFFFASWCHNSQLTTCRCGGGTRDNSWQLSPRGHSLEKSSMLKMLKMSLGRADPMQPLWKQNNRSIDARTKWNRTLG